MKAHLARAGLLREDLIKVHGPNIIPTRDPPNGLEDLHQAILAQMKPRSHALEAPRAIAGAEPLLQMPPTLMVAFEMWLWYSEPR